MSILCGIGMGSPAAPLFWNMAYDAIPVGLAAATGAHCPTYVDDLAALVRGPHQAARAAWFLLFATKAVGLRLSCRGCGLAAPVPVRQRAREAAAGASASRPGKGKPQAKCGNKSEKGS